MTKYIKLGPVGDFFSSSELGLYLTPTNAAEVDDSVLLGRLINFVNTGFVVEISKVEYDNIKLTNNFARNIPLISIPVTKFNVLEPVESIENLPKDNFYATGNRYLIANNITGPWNGHKDHITYYDGTNWQFIKPENNMILPIWNLGISIHYTGTYPSGVWDTAEEILKAITNNPANLTAEEYALEILLGEATLREEADKHLQEQINALASNNGSTGLPATAIALIDVSNYYLGNNVELALQQVAISIGAINTNQFQFQSTLQILEQQISNISGNTILYGSDDPAGQGNNLDTYINKLTGTFFQKIAGTWEEQFSVGELDYLPNRYYGTDEIAFKSFYLGGSGVLEQSYGIPDAQGNIAQRLILNPPDNPGIHYSIQDGSEDWGGLMSLQTSWDSATSTQVLAFNTRIKVPNGLNTLDAVNFSQLDTKEPRITAGISAQYWRGDKTFQTLNSTVVPEGTNLYWTATRFNTAFGTKTTDDLIEGSTNLYWTLARFNTAFAAKSTSDLTEGTNLYWTPSRFNTAFGGKTTTDLIEGTNLYYTSTRVQTLGDARYVKLTNANIANGWAQLDSGGLIPISILPDAILGNVHYKGTYNGTIITSADTALNGNALPSAGSGNVGYYFIATAQFTISSTTWDIGDWIISNGAAGWAKIDNSDAVTTVFGRLGNISAISTDYSAYYPLMASSYNNPSWINQLAWSKITSTPTTLSGYGVLLADTLFDTKYAAITGQAFSGAISTTQLGITGTGGAGYISLLGQSLAPSTPAVGTQNIYADASGRISFMGSNGFALSFSKSLLTASRIYNVPDAAGTFALAGSTLASYGITDAYGTATGSITSAQLANSLTDETGTGAAVFAQIPTFITQIITPAMVGTVANNSTLTLYPTLSASATTGADVVIKTGVSGGTEVARFLNNGTIKLAQLGVGIAHLDSLGNLTSSALTAAEIPSIDWTKITSGKPTTLSGYGITDAYPLAGNPSGFLTSFTESDPTVPAYAKTLTAFSIIQTSTDPLYRPISYVPTFAAITSKPSTLSGYGITDAASLGDDITFLSMQALGSTIKGYALNLPMLNTASTITLGNGVLIYEAVVIPKAATITGVKFWINVTGSYTASNYNGIGLFSISGGTITQVAASTNDGNIWKGSFGANSKAFTSTYAALAGVYYVGLVYSQSAQVTGPVLYSNSSNNAVSAYDFTNSHKVAGTVGSITALPSTQLMSGVTLTSNIPYIQLY